MSNFTPYNKLFLIIISVSLIWTACKKQPETPQKEDPKINEVVLPITGTYLWVFNIPGLGTQESQLIFEEDSVLYSMKGPAYTTDYTMIKESYTENDNEKRWIGVGKGGSIPKDDVYFVMFLKDITDSTVTIYKHECTNGKEEADTFAYPDENATADYGWNVYFKQ